MAARPAPATPADPAATSLAAYDLDWLNPEAMDDNDLVSFVLQHYEDAKHRRYIWESQANEQLAWAEGEQQLTWSEDDDELRALDAAIQDGVPLMAENPIYVNSLKGVVLQKIALLLGGPVQLYGEPRSSDDEDVNAARVATKLLRYVFERSDRPARIRLYRALWMMYCTGPIFPHVYWDAYAGVPERFAPPKGNEGLSGAERKEAASKWDAKMKIADGLGLPVDRDGSIWVPPGDVEWEFLSGFQVSEPEFATTVEDSDWIIVSQFRSMEHLYSRYDSALVDAINPEDEEENLNLHRTEYGNYRERKGGTSAAYVPPELVLVHTLWRPRLPWCPRGAHVIVAGRQLLHKAANPYAHGEIPLGRITEIPGPKFRGKCTVANLMTLQRGRNRMRSQVNAIIQKTVAPQVMMEPGVEIQAGLLDGNDRKLRVSAGALTDGTIRFVEAPAMPKEVFTLDDLYRRDMMDVGEVHESTTGRKEGGQESGRHAAIRVEGDTRSTAVTRELLTEGLAQAGAQTLWLYWQYVKEPRNIHLVGHDFEVDLRDFTGEDLFNQQELGRQPGPQDFNVSVELGRDDQRDENLMMIQVMTELGYWSPATHGHYVERLIGEGLSTEHDKYGWERRNAADEHRRFARGEEVRTALGDDDNIHLEEHYRWTTTAEYRRAEKRDKDLAAALEVHLREHMFNDAQKRHTREMIDALAKEQVQGELRDEAVGAAAPAGTETIPVGPEGVPPGAEALPAGAGGPAPAIPPELIAAAQAGAGGAPM